MEGKLFYKGGGEGVTGQLCIFSYTSRRFKLGNYCPHPPNHHSSRFFLIFYTKVIQYMWNIFIFQFQGYFCHQNKIREKTEQIEVTWATPTLKCYTYLEQYGIHTVHISTFICLKKCFIYLDMYEVQVYQRPFFLKCYTYLKSMLYTQYSAYQRQFVSLCFTYLGKY